MPGHPDVESRTPGRTGALTRERVARAALALVDREGLDALSMRRLATELGVGTMTLYGYVSNRGELLDALLDAAARDVPEPPAQGGWRERLHAHLHAVRAMLVAHPALIRVRVERPILRPEALRLSEAGLALLLQAGFPPGEAARAFRLLFTFVFGTATFEPSGAAVAPVRAQARAAIEALPPGEFPALTATAGEMAGAIGGDEQFDYAAARLLDGLEARLAELRAS